MAVKHSSRNGSVNRADQQAAVAFQRQRDAIMRHAVDIIRCPVERIDDPAVFGPCGASLWCSRPGCLGRQGSKGDSPIFVNHGFAAVPAKIGTVPAFFAQKAMIGKSREHCLANDLLRGEVGLGDQVGGPFLANVESPGPILNHLAAGADRRLADSHVFVKVMA